MPLVTDCPYCQHTSRLREGHVGKKVRCGKCKGVFLVTSPADETEAPPAPAQTFYDIEEPRRFSPAIVAFGISGALLAALAFIVLVMVAAELPALVANRLERAETAARQSN